MSTEFIDQAVSFAGETKPVFSHTAANTAVLSPNISAARPPHRNAQNWVLDPFQDLLLIIAAPLLSLGLAVLAMQYYGAARGAAMVITAHIVLTVAHHMPTFIRIYGDLDLFQRFKWSFILGPVVPLVFSAGVLAYINYHEYPVEYFLYLYIFLALWDPWHFLRQHFGFMRIYDRHNKAPVRLASNMDWTICAIWFVHIMAASADWIPGLLEDLYRNTHIPLLLILPQGFISTLKITTWWFAVATSVCYAIYLIWCFKRGYYISLAKLALLLCTFGVMYFTYTPNEWILQLVPAWSFKVGFATLGIVHMTQYLAIVWRYDRRITQQGKARPNWFQWLHARRTPAGIALAAAVYVLFCIAYGDFITTSHESRWLMSALLAIGFTSTLMHYYFDGFIWRIRHQQNREALGLQITETNNREENVATRNSDAIEKTISTYNVPAVTSSLQQSAEDGLSWWSGAVKNNNVKKSFVQKAAAHIFLRQLVYFGLPMALLTIGAISVWSDGNTSYLHHMYHAQTLSQQGQPEAAANAARLAYASMQAELPFAEKIAEIKPNSANQAQLAFLIYNESLYKNRILPALDGLNPTTNQLQAHTTQTRKAADLLQNAISRGEEISHPGREQLTTDDANKILISWRRQAQMQ